MKSCTILYTANAGFFLMTDSVTVAVDPFPRRKSRGFSALAEADFLTLCKDSRLTGADYMIVTHDHPDHYSHSWTERFLSLCPQTRFFGAARPARLPETAAGTLPPVSLEGCHPIYYLQGITLEFMRLAHEGAEFADLPNYGCYLTVAKAGTGQNDGPLRLLFLGDAAPSDPAIAAWLSGRPVDLALLNFPWITLPRHRRFLAECIHPQKLILLHLPYEADDRNGYLPAARAALAACEKELSLEGCLLTRFAQTVRVIL